MEGQGPEEAGPALMTAGHHEIAVASRAARLGEEASLASRVWRRKTYCSGGAAWPGAPRGGTPGQLAVRAGAFEEAMWY